MKILILITSSFAILLFSACTEKEPEEKDHSPPILEVIASFDGESHVIWHNESVSFDIKCSVASEKSYDLKSLDIRIIDKDGNKTSTDQITGTSFTTNFKYTLEGDYPKAEIITILFTLKNQNGQTAEKSFRLYTSDHATLKPYTNVELGAQESNLPQAFSTSNGSKYSILNDEAEKNQTYIDFIYLYHMLGTQPRTAVFVSPDDTIIWGTNSDGKVKYNIHNWKTRNKSIFKLIPTGFVLPKEFVQLSSDDIVKLFFDSSTYPKSMFPYIKDTPPDYGAFLTHELKFGIFKINKLKAKEEDIIKGSVEFDLKVQE